MSGLRHQLSLPLRQRHTRRRWTSPQLSVRKCPLSKRKSPRFHRRTRPGRARREPWNAAWVSEKARKVSSVHLKRHRDDDQAFVQGSQDRRREGVAEVHNICGRRLKPTGQNTWVASWAGGASLVEPTCSWVAAPSGSSFSIWFAMTWPGPARPITFSKIPCPAHQCSEIFDPARPGPYTFSNQPGPDHRPVRSPANFRGGVVVRVYRVIRPGVSNLHCVLYTKVQPTEGSFLRQVVSLKYHCALFGAPPNYVAL